MQVTVTYEHKKELFDSINVEGLVLFVLEQMKCPTNTDVSLTFVTDEKIHTLNREYRGIDKPTDVLSFECDNVPFENEDFNDALEYELGDIVIASEVALRQTEEFATTFEEEITLLVVHGSFASLWLRSYRRQKRQNNGSPRRQLIADGETLVTVVFVITSF